MLRRFINYTGKIFDVWRRLDEVPDSRKCPEIPGAHILRSVMMMLTNRLGSLNAVAQSFLSPFWKRFIRGKPPSADTIGRVMELMSTESLRKLLKEVYARIRRNKTALRTIAGLQVLVLDGHESHASCRRKCSGCLERTIKTKNGEHTEYYHRHVLAILLMPGGCLLLDVEAQKSGEDEVAVAVRLLSRLLVVYPRAFDVVIADALYARAGFFNFLTKHGKQAMAVLKNEDRHLVRDAEGLYTLSPSITLTERNVIRTISDIEELTSWEGVESPVRVIRSVERLRVKRQRSKTVEETERTWWWVTTIPVSLLPTAAAVELGHARWCVENQGFNETVNHWHADHIYKHAADAILNFHLMMMLVYNLFHQFIHRNLKPALTRIVSKSHISRLMLSELLQENFSPLSLDTT